MFYFRRTNLEFVYTIDKFQLFSASYFFLLCITFQVGYTPVFEKTGMYLLIA